MSLLFSSFAFGVAGFFGFELLRVYKHCLPTGKSPYPKSQRNVIVVTMIGVGFFSGLVAALWSPDDLSKALYIGFSIPTASKHIFSQSPGRSSSVSVDDIRLIDPAIATNVPIEGTRTNGFRAGIWKEVAAALSTYFRF